MSSWKEKVNEELRCCVPVYDHLEENIRLSAGLLSPQFISMQYSTVVTLTDASEHASILHLSYSNRCCSIVWLWFLRVKILSTLYQHCGKANGCHIFLPSDLWGVENLEFRNCWMWSVSESHKFFTYIHHASTLSKKKLQSDATFKCGNIKKKQLFSVNNSLQVVVFHSAADMHIAPILSLSVFIL